MSSIKLKTRFLFISFLLTVLLSRELWYWSHDARQYRAGDFANVTATLAEEPIVSQGRQSFVLTGYHIWTAVYPEYHFGDQLKVTGPISCAAKANVCNSPNLYKVETKLVTRQGTNPWVMAALAIRSKFIETYHNILPYAQANLLTGVVLGNIGVDPQLRDKLAATGLTHVIAASGMNVSIFSGFVIWLLSALKLHRRLICFLSMLFVLFYCTITGFEPPVVRAAIMAGFMMVAVVVGRQADGWLGLALAGYFMLWVTPELIISPSFLLSFTAMAGQIYTGSRGPKLPEKSGLLVNSIASIKEIFIQSLAAILFTFPMVVVFFAKFSLISLFTNVLVLWTVEPLMVLGGLAGIMGIVWEEGAKLIALAAYPLLGFFLGVVNLFSKSDIFLLRLPGLDWTFILGYYLVLAAVLMLGHGQKHASLDLMARRKK